MTTPELADALKEWCLGVLPDLVGSYDHRAPRHTQGLPEVEVDITRRALTRSDPRFRRPMQQEILDVSDCALYVAVKPEPPKEAIETLRGFGDDLLVAIRADLTLGGIGETGPPWEIDFSLGDTGGVVIFPDESEGRAFALRLGVCERVPEP